MSLAFPSLSSPLILLIKYGHQRRSGMSHQQQDVVQRLDEGEEAGEFVGEDDVLEVEELEDGMQVESGDEGDDDGAEGEQEQEQDGAERLLDNGFDDSVVTFDGHHPATAPSQDDDDDDGDSPAIFALSLHPTLPIVLSGGSDDLGHLWRADTGKEIAKLTGHTDSVTSVGFSFDGEMVATGGMDGRVRIWRRVKTGTEGANGPTVEQSLRWEFLTNLEGPDEVNVSVWKWHQDEMESEGWIDTDGNLLLAGGADGTVWLWQLPSGNTLHVLSGHVESVSVGRFTPDGKKIVTASVDSTLILWDPRTGQPIHKLSPTDARFLLSGGITSLAINPTSTIAIAGGAEGGLRAINLGSGVVLAQMNGHEEGSSVEGIEFSEGSTGGGAGGTAGGVVVSVGTDGRVITWEAGNFKLRSIGLHEDAITSLSFIPGTTSFVTSSADRTLKQWDYRTGSVSQTYLGHRDVIHCLGVSKDGKYFVSGGDDGFGKVFEVGKAESMGRVEDGAHAMRE